MKLTGPQMLRAFNSGREDVTTAQALHRVQAAILFANNLDNPPLNAFPEDLREELTRKKNERR